jgi:hypothetical protein
MKPITFAQTDDDLDNPLGDFDYHGGCMAPHSTPNVRIPA